MTTITSSSNFSAVRTDQLNVTIDAYINELTVNNITVLDLIVEDLDVTGTLTFNEMTNGIITIESNTITGLTFTPTNPSEATSKSYVDLVAVPAGGTASQVLSKIDATDYNTTWVNIGAISGGLPIGGTAGQLLSKIDATDYNAQWVFPGTANRLAYFDSGQVFGSIDSFAINTYEGLDLTQTQSISNTSVNLNSYISSIDPSVSIVNNYVARENSTLNAIPNGIFEFYDIYDTNRTLNISTTTVNGITKDFSYLNLDSSTTCSYIVDTNSSRDIYGTVTQSITGNRQSSIIRPSSDLSGIYYNGFEFSPSIESGATVATTSLSGYYCNIGTDEQISSFNAFQVNGYGTGAPTSYTGFGSFPDFQGTISSYQGVNISHGANSDIENFTGVSVFTNRTNNSYEGLNVNADISTLDSYFNGVAINPTIGSVQNGTGIQVNMTNVTPLAGTPGTAVIQDLTYTSQNSGDNGISIEYFDAAGPSIVTFGNSIQITFSTGTQTASQIKTLVEGFAAAAFLVSVAITGLDVAQTSPVADTPLTGGINDGTVKAASFIGDVEIDGNLTFTGALSIGQLNSFYTQEIIESVSPGVPTSLDTLITGVTALDSTTYNNADTIGLNTAFLINLEDNSTVNTSFIGVTAIGLPAVLNMGTGSTIDQVAGATFAISLDAGSTGGTVDNLSLCRALGIPNGTTTITKLKGYNFQLPFGSLGTTEWGIYMEPDCNNFIKGTLKIGGTAGSDDTVASGSNIGLEITDKHIASKQVATTTTIGSFAGTNSGSLSIATDVAGILELTTGAAFATGAQCVVTFGTTYTQEPIVQLTARNATSGTNAISVYVTATVSDFTINFAVADVGVNTYQWYYTIIQTV